MPLPHHAMQTKCWTNMFHWSQTHISSNTLLPSIYDTMLSMSEYSQHSEYSILLQPVWHSSSCLLPAVGRKDWWQWFLTYYGPTNSKKISAHPRLSLYDSIGRIGVPSYYWYQRSEPAVAQLWSATLHKKERRGTSDISHIQGRLVPVDQQSWILPLLSRELRLVI